MPSFDLVVNGKVETVAAEGGTPLLWVLREWLGLTGTKYGCGVGQCGACTVHVDGRAVRSCTLPLASVGRRRVTTVEGLAGTPLAVVQQAWIAEQVPQCGYCQSGQIMAAAALLLRDRAPTDAAVTVALDGNLCRCGTYPRILRAVHRAAEALRHDPSRQAL